LGYFRVVRRYTWVALGVLAGALAPAIPTASAPALAPAFPGLLDGVAATSAASAWAVGDDGAGDTLIVHWNGHAWQKAAAPTPHPRNDRQLGSTAGFSVDYLSTDANGVQTYDMISANNGYGPQFLRVLKHTNPPRGGAQLPVRAAR
jgi:hypothetical protein